VIKAMDILHTAEKIMDGGKSIDPTKSGFMVPGAFVTADIPGSEDTIYRILSIEGNDIAKIKSLETKNVYDVPTEFLSLVLINDPFDDDSIKTFKDSGDTDGLPTAKINQVGVKKTTDDPKEMPDKTGVYLLKGQPQYAQSRYNRRNQFANERSLDKRQYDR
jgi:hypothetical protein